MALTTSQRAAVAYDGNLIIFAGPGSGKTATFVEKGLRTLQKPGTVLGMDTFTKAAAHEMRERMAAAAGKNSHLLQQNRLVVGTFNSITKRHYEQHMRNALKLLPPAARSALVGSMLRDRDLLEREEFTSALDAYLARLNPRLEDFHDAHAAFIRKYQDKLRASHAIDPAGMMRECTVRIASGEMPRLPLTHILGDEMQDADEIQFEFMLAHVRAGVIGTLVADDDQTIYEWRSAMGYAGLTHFADNASAKTIVLAENFRSRDEIVAHATTLIAHNDPNRIPKNQQPVRGPGGLLAHVRCADLEVECNRVASSIERFRAPGESVAVLARTNFALWSMQSALLKRRIAYRRDGPSMWDTPEVAVYMALLKALVTHQMPDLVGTDSARLLIGSANLTASGLSGNLEVVGEVRMPAGDDTNLALMRDALDFICQFVGPMEYAAMQQLEWARGRSPWLTRSAPVPGDNVLLATPAGMGIGQRLVDLVTGEQVDRLLVVSPYWDENLSTVRFLLEGLSPKRAALVIQPDAALFPSGNPGTAALYDLGPLTQSTGRFAHAKLIVVQTESADHPFLSSA